MAGVRPPGPVGARTRRNLLALALAVPGVYLLTGVRLEAEPVGVAFAFANAVLFSADIVLGHRVARHGAAAGINGLAAAILIAAVLVSAVALVVAGVALHRDPRADDRPGRQSLAVHTDQERDPQPRYDR